MWEISGAGGGNNTTGGDGWVVGHRLKDQHGRVHHKMLL